MVYSALFGVGKLLLHHRLLGIFLVLISAACAWRMAKELTCGQGALEVASVTIQDAGQRAGN
jgi:hypothetical protein